MVWNKSTLTLFASFVCLFACLFLWRMSPTKWYQSTTLCAGLGISLVYLPSHVLCGLYYERHQSLATGIATSGSGLGGAIMPIVIGTLIEDYGWKGSLIIVGGIELHLIVCAALLRPPPTGKAAEKTKDRKTHALLNGTCSRSEDGSANEADRKSTEPLGRYKEELTSPEDTGRETTATDEKASAINNTGVEFQAFTESILCKSDTLNEGEGISADKQELATKPADCPGDTYIAQPQVSTDTSSRQHTMADSESCPAETEAKVLRQIYLFTDAGFDIYFLSCVFWNIGATTVLSFGPEFTTEAGISALDSAWLLTLFGLGSFVGSLIGGMTGNTWTKTRESQYVAANFLLGICTAVVPLGSTFGEFAAILLTDGIAFGVILGLLVVVLTDIVGTNNLGDGLGYIMLANGIGAFVGPSLTGLCMLAFRFILFLWNWKCSPTGLRMLGFQIILVFSGTEHFLWLVCVCQHFNGLCLGNWASSPTGLRILAF